MRLLEMKDEKEKNNAQAQVQGRQCMRFDSGLLWKKVNWELHTSRCLARFLLLL